MKKKIIVTGAAGFIGFHLCKKLIKNNFVIGLDNISPYYSKKLKKDRIKELKNKNFKFFKIDLKKKNLVKRIFKIYKPDYVYHLAAQAGVRYSLIKPQNYINNNVTVFQNILDLSREFNIKILLYASSSSVYGDNKDTTLNTNSKTDKPISPYAVTKKTNEMMAYAYSHLYKFPTIGFRFFTVYGPWGRPDMSLYKFTHNIINNRKIEIFNNGNHKRDFTYIDDVVRTLNRAIIKFGSKKKINNFFKNKPPSLILNISGDKTITLLNYLRIISKKLRKKPTIIYRKLQPGDVIKTSANNVWTKKILNYKPLTPLSKGITKFIKWYSVYYSRKK